MNDCDARHAPPLAPPRCPTHRAPLTKHGVFWMCVPCYRSADKKRAGPPASRVVRERIK